MTAPRNRHGQMIGAAVAGWTPRPVPTATAIEGLYCRLEPFTIADHAGDLIAGFGTAQDDRDWTWWRNPRPADAEGYIEEFRRIADNPAFVAFAIVEPHDGRAVGYAAYMGIDAENGSIEIGGIHFTPALRHRPGGTEALFLLMRRAFDDLGYRRLEWQCNSLNTMSVAAALRLGFTPEGVFRQKMITQGRNRDTAWFSILDHEWPAIRRGIEAWLDPGNFDGDGTQRVALAELRGRFAMDRTAPNGSD